MKNISHISPKNKFWRIKRKINDRIFTARSIVKELAMNILFLIKNPNEYFKTQDTIYLVFTMGKVASTSVFYSIQKRLPHVKTFAMHYLSYENLQKQEKLLEKSIYKKMHTKHANKITQYLRKHPHKEIKIITIVREPISQIISQVFQQLSLYNINDLEELQLENSQLDYQYPELWCENELMKFTGVNVLNEPFDKEKGYALYQHKQGMLLVLKFEKLGKIFGDAMQQLSGVDHWLLRSENVSTSKAYAGAYQVFKKQVHIEDALFNKIYTSKFSNQFYTKNELEIFKQKWKSYKQ